MHRRLSGAGDLPLIFHPARTRVSGLATPCGAVGATLPEDRSKTKMQAIDLADDFALRGGGSFKHKAELERRASGRMINLTVKLFGHTASRDCLGNCV
jgi:hypothetical protein